MQTVENAIEDQVAEGDTVVTLWTTHGTNTGSLFGMPATNKPATITGITIDHIVGGKIVETWTNFDALGMLQQLGVVPAPGQSSLHRLQPLSHQELESLRDCKIVCVNGRSSRGNN